MEFAYWVFLLLLLVVSAACLSWWLTASAPASTPGSRGNWASGATVDRDPARPRVIARGDYEDPILGTRDDWASSAMTGRDPARTRALARGDADVSAPGSRGNWANPTWPRAFSRGDVDNDDAPAPGAEAVAQGENALAATMTGQRVNTRFAAASSSAFNGKTSAFAST